MQLHTNRTHEEGPVNLNYIIGLVVLVILIILLFQLI